MPNDLTPKKSSTLFEKIGAFGSIMTAFVGLIAVFEWNSSRKDKEILAKTLLAVQQQATLHAQTFRPLFRPPKEICELDMIMNTTNLSFQNIGGGQAVDAKIMLREIEGVQVKGYFANFTHRSLNRIGPSGLLDTWEVKTIPLTPDVSQMKSFSGILELSYKDSSQKEYSQFFRFKCESDVVLKTENTSLEPFSLTIEEIPEWKFDLSGILG